MHREFTSQHHSSSTSTTSSSTTSNQGQTTTAPAVSVGTTSQSPISRRRARQQQHRRARLDTQLRHPLRASNSHSHAQCHSHNHNHNHRSASSVKLALRNPALAHKLQQMALPLSPLVQLTTGAIHPHFPTNVLQFWLLTDSQLEALAAFYHQSGAPSPWAAQYPCPVHWRSDAPLEEKRRRMGRFIGLRGCESPVSEVPPHAHAIKTEDEIAREARMARMAADDEALRRKTAPGPWGR